MTHRAAELRILTWNTHAGLGLIHGGLLPLIRETRPDQVALQEVRHLDQVDVDRKDWWVTPATLPGLSGTVILSLAERFKLIDYTDDLILRGLSRMHPQRRLTATRVRDHETGRVVCGVNIHNWAMGKGLRLAQPLIRRSHVKYTHAVADWCESRADSRVVWGAGDVNEDIVGTVHPSYADRTTVKIMRDAGMLSSALLRGGSRPTSVDGPAVLDDVFVRRCDFVDVVDRTVIDVPSKGNDHRAVLTVLKVRKDSAAPTTRHHV